VTSCAMAATEPRGVRKKSYRSPATLVLSSDGHAQIAAVKDTRIGRVKVQPVGDQRPRGTTRSTSAPHWSQR
jgi:hypothetical protein